MLKKIRVGRSIFVLILFFISFWNDVKSKNDFLIDHKFTLKVDSAHIMHEILRIRLIRDC